MDAILNADGESAAIGPQLRRGEFVPLPNFLPGDERYRNTCFIAAVVSCASVIPEIVDFFELDERSWTNTIEYVRSAFDGKYAYSSDHGGQHDAAELLGDVLFNTPSLRFRKARITTIPICSGGLQHRWENELGSLCSMLVLELPPGRGPCRLKDLADNYFAATALNGLTCEVCRGRNKNGRAREKLCGDVCNSITLRINRYGALDKRDDPVAIAAELQFWDVRFELCAVIEHTGRTKQSGHYFAWVRTPQYWERRDDAERRLFPLSGTPPVTETSVYVLIYQKGEAGPRRFQIRVENHMLQLQVL